MTVRVGDSSFQSNANLTVNGVAVLQDCALGCGQYSDITVLVPVYPFTATTSTTNGGKSGEEGVVVPPLAIHLSSTMGSTGTSHKKDATRYVKSVFIVHVGGTRCVTSSTDNIIKIHARITLTVEFIRTRIFLFLFDVSIQGRV